MLFAHHRRLWLLARSFALFAVLAMLLLPVLHRMSMPVEVRPLFCTAQGAANSLVSGVATPSDSAPLPMALLCKVCVVSAQLQALLPPMRIAVPLLVSVGKVDLPSIDHAVHLCLAGHWRPPSHAPPRVISAHIA